MYNHNKAQQSKNRVHISWDILYVYRILNPGAERINAKCQYILHRKWTHRCILCTHPKSHKLDEGLMLIFVSGKKMAVTFGEGCKGWVMKIPVFFWLFVISPSQQLKIALSNPCILKLSLLTYYFCKDKYGALSITRSSYSPKNSRPIGRGVFFYEFIVWTKFQLSLVLCSISCYNRPRYIESL